MENIIWVSHLESLEEGSHASISARVVGFRSMGNLCFGHIQDATGRFQFCLKKNESETAEDYKSISKSVSNGCFISIAGRLWVSSTGEKTLLASKASVLSKPHTPIPSQFYGVSDEEASIRKRYLQTAIDSDAANIFVVRSRVIASIRGFLQEEGFLEVETPSLTPSASGAMARPFVTHHNSLDKDFYLRIAPETYLKMLTAGGFNKVFEIGKSFRNEGIDRSHLQEFTSLEWYNAFADYQDNKKLFYKMILHIIWGTGNMSGVVRWGDWHLNFNSISTVKYRDLFLASGFDSPDNYSASEADEIFKRSIRPNIIQPTFVEDYPAHMSPMAARKPDDESTVEQWQLIVGGWEIVKCYTELTDPLLQRELLEQQMADRASGNEEAMMIDEAFLEAMEYGMPPQSGLGLGIDRLICILTNNTSLRDVIYFPMVR